MTEYFDDTGRKLAAVDIHDSAQWGKFEQIEGKLVHDVSVCQQMPGFPKDLSFAIDRLVQLKSAGFRPNIPFGKVRFPPADFEYVQDLRRVLYDLNGDLHTIFHEVARRARDGEIPDRYSDSPLLPVRALANEAHDRRDDEGAALVAFLHILPWLQGGEPGWPSRRSPPPHGHETCIGCSVCFEVPE